MRIISSTPSELKIDTVTFAFYQYIIEETDVPLYGAEDYDITYGAYTTN